MRGWWSRNLQHDCIPVRKRGLHRLLVCILPKPDCVCEARKYYHCPSCSRSPASSLCLCQWARCVLQSLQHDIQFHILRPLEIKHFNWIHNTHTNIHKRENIVKSWVTFCSVRYLPRRMGDMAVMLLRIPTRFPYPLNIFELNFVFFRSVLLEDAQLYVRRQNDRLYSSKNFEQNIGASNSSSLNGWV